MDEAIGSSPRERGTPKKCPRPSAATAVHPRASGEHAHGSRAPYRSAGSSPRERGTPPHELGWSPAGRFIPARAGNTARRSCKTDTCPVHPRASGEHACIRSRMASSRGSSPRERGTRSVEMHSYALLRFIPARAGNTRRMARHFDPDTGSSPRERGTRSWGGSGGGIIRFIPARAGNTVSAPRPSILVTVHPRASGEHGETEATTGQ